MMTWPARSPPPQTRRPVYIVHSPPNTDIDKISTGSGFSPFESPANRQCQVRPYHHDSVAESSYTETPQLSSLSTSPLLPSSSAIPSSSLPPMENFSQRRKSERIAETKILGNQVALYGGVPALYAQRTKPDLVVLPFNLTFTLRSRTYVLGRLVKTTFYSNIRCSITFHGDKLGETLDLSKCSDH